MNNMNIAEKIADYVGFVNKADRDNLIDFVNDYLQNQEIAYYKMKDCLECLSNFREGCHNYDRDMGDELRSFDEETIDMMEQLALGTLRSVNELEDKN